MEHQHRDVRMSGGPLARIGRVFLWTDIVTVEGLAIGSGYLEVFKVGKAELGRFGHLGSREVGDM
jgi:hypothetical protein